MPEKLAFQLIACNARITRFMVPCPNKVDRKVTMQCEHGHTMKILLCEQHLQGMIEGLATCIDCTDHICPVKMI